MVSAARPSMPALSFSRRRPLLAVAIAALVAAYATPLAPAVAEEPARGLPSQWVPSTAHVIPKFPAPKGEG